MTCEAVALCDYITLALCHLFRDEHECFFSLCYNITPERTHHWRRIPLIDTSVTIFDGCNSCDNTSVFFVSQFDLFHTTRRRMLLPSRKHESAKFLRMGILFSIAFCHNQVVMHSISGSVLLPCPCRVTHKKFPCRACYVSPGRLWTELHNVLRKLWICRFNYLRDNLLCLHRNFYHSSTEWLW